MPKHNTTVYWPAGSTQGFYDDQHPYSKQKVADILARSLEEGGGMMIGTIPWRSLHTIKDPGYYYLMLDDGNMCAEWIEGYEDAPEDVEAIAGPLPTPAEISNDIVESGITDEDVSIF